MKIQAINHTVIQSLSQISLMQSTTTAFFQKLFTDMTKYSKPNISSMK